MSEVARIAVTGGTGFIGQHLVSDLEKRDVEVVATFHETAPDCTLGARWVQLELDKPSTTCFEAFDRPDSVIHLAWSGLSNYRLPEHLETELPRQLSFLKSLVDQGLKNIVIVGTCFEYGMREGELNEVDATAPHLPYGQAKDQLRKDFQRYCVERNTKFTWLRPFYLYGEGQPERSLYSQFRRSVLAGEKSFNMSPGDQQRDYLPVEVAARLISDLSLQMRDHGVVNICSGRPVSVRTLVEGWRSEMASDIALNLGYYPYPDWEPMSFWGSTEKLQALTV